MAWASEAEVAAITGVTVTAPQLAQAQAVVELACGRAETVIGTSANEGTIGDYTGRTKDLRLLKSAVAFQAAGMVSGGVVVHTPGGLGSITQPDLALGFDAPEGSDGDLRRVLAPLTRDALAQLSWRRNRSVPLASDLTTALDADLDNDRDHNGSSMGSGPWTPIGD